jgi:inhibitor of growth protein 4
MGFLEDFQASVEALPAMLHKNYSLMRELDKSLQGVQLENEQRCQQEIEDIKHGLESGSITFDPAKLKFSDEAIEEQKHCIRIADEKVALATQTYDLVDAHIQQLDQFMRKLEELRQEKEAAAAVSAGTAVAATAVTANANAGVSTADATPKGGRSGERGRGGRKKAKVQPELPLPAPTIDLELPVDPNEPTYCLCNQVSYGEMVACDNSDCKIEWFHFGCVGVKEQPKGKWYCPNCIGFQKKRKGK